MLESTPEASLSIIDRTHLMMTLKARVVTVGTAVIIILSTLMITVTTNGLTNLVFAQGPLTIVINLTGSE